MATLNELRTAVSGILALPPVPAILQLNRAVDTVDLCLDGIFPRLAAVN